MTRALETASSPRPSALPAYAAALAGALTVFSAAIPEIVLAAEGGSGFYLLGQRGSRAAVLPPPGTYLRFDGYGYSGSQAEPIALGGGVDMDTEVDAVLPIVTGAWLPDAEGPGGTQPFFAVSVISGWKDVATTIRFPGIDGGMIGSTAEESDFLLGDPILVAGLGGTGGNWHWTGTLSVNVPIGDYSAERLTNVAFNRWGVDGTAALTWLDPVSGWEASLAAGLTWNGENPDTDYDTGEEAHLEAALSRSFASGLTLGLNGYHYRQITDDSGDGALLGGFRGEVSALGPSIAFTAAPGGWPVAAEARFYREFDAVNRTEGDALFLTLVAPLPF